jgi:hypothetical protein
MQGRTRTSRPAAEVLEAGTHQLTLVRAFIEIGMPKQEYCKKDETGRMKTPEESAYAQACLIWKDSESGAEVKDKFLKMPEELEFSGDARYKSKFQKRIENLLNKQLDDDGGNHINLDFDFITDWPELMEAIREEENGRPATVSVKAMQWDGHEMFGREWLVTVAVNDKGYNEVSSVSPLPKRRATAAPAAQPELVAAAPAPRANTTEPAHAGPRPRSAAPQALTQAETDLPF